MAMVDLLLGAGSMAMGDTKAPEAVATA